MLDIPDWTPLVGSSRIVAECYLPEAETILVRFPDGVEWQYRACRMATWLAFTAPGQSRGAFIRNELNRVRSRQLRCGYQKFGR